MNMTLKLFLFILLFSCAPDTIEEDTSESSTVDPVRTVSQVPQNLNLSILMDLSDRISPEKYPNPTMEYYQRDVEHIKSVLNGFQSVVLNKRVRTIDDHVNAYFDPPPKSREIIKHADRMKVDFTRENVTKEAIANVDQVFAESALAIYEQAIKDGKYVGSDTWGFFKNNLERYCIRENYRNVLVILTDGYIYHRDQKREEGNRTSYVTPEKIRALKLNDSNWKNKMLENNIGFIPVDVDLSDLDVLVLGINPDDKNDYEADVLLEYWGEWLESMNINKYEILMTDLPSNLDRTI
ncbi:MAG: hypothetical protein WBG42_01970, partial [Cryomorphaceae bacterium]